MDVPSEKLPVSPVLILAPAQDLLSQRSHAAHILRAEVAGAVHPSFSDSSMFSVERGTAHPHTSPAPSETHRGPRKGTSPETAKNRSVRRNPHRHPIS